MNWHDNFHSRVVVWLKVALPLAALAILSTLFLFSRTIDPNDAIPFAKGDVEARLREPRLTAPTWAGVTDDGSSLTVSAAEVRAGETNGTSPAAQSLTALLETPDGGWVNLVAARGALDTGTATLTMAGGVVVTTGNGYRLTTGEMTAALDRTSLTSRTKVTGDGPPGHLEAGAMEIRADAAQSGQYLLVFKQGVKLLYQPLK